MKRKWYPGAELGANKRRFEHASMERGYALNELQSAQCVPELPTVERGFDSTPPRMPYRFSDSKKSQPEPEGMTYDPPSHDRFQNSHQCPTTTSACDVKSTVDISLPTSPSGLTSEQVNKTDRSDHMVRSPHSSPIMQSETVDMPTFAVLEAGHWTLEMWPSIAENIRGRYRDIMGVGNMGSVNLLSCGNSGSKGTNPQGSPAPGSPAVCISCKYPDRIDRSLLQEILGPLKDLPIVVGSGSVRRSAYDENCCTPKGTCLLCQGKMLASAFAYGPAAYGRYMQRPDCGASIGVNDIGLERERVSLGGYLSLNIGGRWISAAVTCHHLIDDSSVETPGIQSRVDGAGDYSTPGVKYSIQSSAKIDHDGEVERLKQRVENNDKSSQKFEGTNIMDAYKSLVGAQLHFGEARCSSGISIDEVENLQVHLSGILQLCLGVLLTCFVDGLDAH